jgi:hypothetical protein
MRVKGVGVRLLATSPLDAIGSTPQSLSTVASRGAYTESGTVYITAKV